MLYIKVPIHILCIYTVEVHRHVYVQSTCVCFQCFTLTFAVDIWSVGCICAEMVRGKILLPGRDCIFI